jgi:hypothetical protein
MNATTIVVGAITFILIFVIGAVAIGREARRLDTFSPVPTLDVEEAVDWIGEHLPQELSGSLAYTDVRRILDWHLEELQRRGLASESIVVHGPDGRLIEDFTVIDDAMVKLLVERSAVDTPLYSDEEVRAVLEAHLGYLERIGAIGPVAADET